MCAQKSILVVDDDRDILEVVKFALEREAYVVQTSPNSAPFSRLDRDKPDLILLDIMLLGEDGRELCKQLKSSETTRSIPVILFSAHVDTNQAALACGADDFLDKPFDLDTLLYKVNKNIGSAV